MSYYKAHPRKKEAKDWLDAGRPGGSVGLYCNRFGVYPLPEMAIPEWADPDWRRQSPGLGVHALDDAVARNAPRYFAYGRDFRRLSPAEREDAYSCLVRYFDALEDLQLLDPFWRGQVRGRESGLGKKLWREEREAYEAMSPMSRVETREVPA